MKIKNKRLFTAVCLLFLACAITFFSIGYGQAERENSVFFENVRGVKNVSSFELPAELGGLRGIKIEAGANAVARFSNTVDLNSLQDNANVIKFQVLGSKNYEYAAMDDIRIRMTDANDPDISLQFTYAQVPVISEWNAAQSYFLAGTDNKNMWGYDFYRNEYFHNEYGTVVRASFVEESAELFGFHYDVDKNEVWLDTVDNAFGTPLVCAELSNPEVVGENNVFGGFTTGEVYVQIEFPMFNGTAAVVVTEICGNKLTENDDAAPSIICETDKDYKNNLPNAEVGRNYPVPSAKALDVFDGECGVSVSVRMKGGESEPATDYFIPAAAGDFEIVYVAQDAAGNTAEKILAFSAVPQIPDITASFGRPVGNFTVGEEFVFPEISLSGGSGKIKYEYDIYFNGVLCDSASFTAYEEGKLEYRIFAADYLSEEPVEIVLTIDAVAAEKPIVRIEGIPDAVLAGSTVILPDFESVIYKGGAKEAPRSIYVNSRKLDETRSFEAKGDEETLTVAYVTGLGENQVVENYIIKVISPKNYADYFINEDNVKKELTAEGTKFSFSEDATIKMPFKIASEGFYTNLNVVGDNHGFEKLTVYLEDFYDKNNAIALTFTDYNENLCNLSVNFSETVYRMRGSLSNENQKLSFHYSDCAVRDEGGNFVAPITSNLKGTDFTGFESGLIRVRYVFSGVNRMSEVNFFQVGNQTFTKFSNTVAIGPQIIYSEEISSGEISFGSRMVVPAARAQAVISDQSTVNVSVTAPDGSVLVNKGSCLENRTFTAGQYGTYKIVYEAVHSGNFSTKETFNITSSDFEAPQIAVKSFKTNYACGESLKVPNAIVYDSRDPSPTLKIYFVDGSMKYREVQSGEKVKLEQTGTFALVFYAFDADYNICRKQFAIKVSK